MNIMQKPIVEKITLNIGAGKDQAKLDKGITLLKSITGIEPVKTFAKKRIPAWGLRPGLPIGCKITLRKQKALELLKRLLKANDNKLNGGQFDNSGNVSFGIPEYIDIPGIKYDPEIGIMGLEVCVTLTKKGYRIKLRRLQRKKISKRHALTKKEAIDFMREEFSISLQEEE